MRGLLLFLCLTFALITDTIGCPSGNYECESGYPRCILQEEKCNGAEDCADGSDEGRENCVSCPSGNYKCESGYPRCIPQEQKCDGAKDCADGSDEGREKCADVIGGAIGGALGGILLCCICPCVLCICAGCWINKMNRRNGVVIRRTHFELNPTHTTPNVPSNTTHTAASQQHDEFNPEEVCTASKPPKDPELYDAKPPPAYPATQFTTYPSSPPPGYDISGPGYSIGFDIGTNGHFTSGHDGGMSGVGYDGDGESESCGGGDGSCGGGSGGGSDD